MAEDDRLDFVSPGLVKADGEESSAIVDPNLQWDGGFKLFSSTILSVIVRKLFEIGSIALESSLLIASD